MNLEHAIIALTKEVHGLSEQIHALTEKVDILTGRVDFLTEQVNHHSEVLDGHTEILERHSDELRSHGDELRHRGVMIEHLDGKLNLLIDGYTALDKKIEDFRDEVNGKFKEIDYKFEVVFEDVGALRKELYGFCRS
jgi:uncharacterized protein YoxC